MPTPGTELATAKPRPNWPLRLTYAAVAVSVLLLVGSPLAFRSYRVRKAEQQMAEAIAEADRDDPLWRWNDLQRSRGSVPDAENAALSVLSTANKIPANWPPPRTLPTGIAAEVPLYEEVLDCPTGQQIPEELLKPLRTALTDVQPALAEAAHLVRFTRGRFPGPSDFDGWFSITLDRGQEARKAVWLLNLDAALHAQENRPREALLAARAGLNAGRALGDEPTLIAHLVRNACLNVAAASIERTLGLTQPTADDLLATQKLLEDELAQPTFFWAMRGERAYQYETLLCLSDPERLQKRIGSQYKLGWKQSLEMWFSADSFIASRASTLKHLNRLVEASRLPIQEQRKAVRELDQSLEVLAGPEGQSSKQEDLLVRLLPPAHQEDLLVRLLTPAHEKYLQAYHRCYAQLGTAAVALAAERYRIKQGRWPVKLDELVPEFIEKIPVDPFATGPLKLARLEDGIVIYSVGPDEIDDGGKLNRAGGNVLNTDVGFRLLDPAKRRQPPPKPAGEEGTP